MRLGDLTEAVHDQIGVYFPVTEAIVKEVFDQIALSLAQGNEVHVRGFGRFQLRVRAAKSARHPVSGARIHVPPRVIVTFKPSEALLERVE